MNKLIKPQEQSYTGDDTQVVAYARVCEMAWVTQTICVGGISAAALLWGVPPILAAIGVSCAIHYVFFAAACEGVI